MYPLRTEDESPPIATLSMSIKLIISLLLQIFLPLPPLTDRKRFNITTGRRTSSFYPFVSDYYRFILGLSKTPPNISESSGYHLSTFVQGSPFLGHNSTVYVSYIKGSKMGSRGCRLMNSMYMTIFPLLFCETPDVSCPWSIPNLQTGEDLSTILN